jgi:hypothetical protein
MVLTIEGRGPALSEKFKSSGYEPKINRCSSFEKVSTVFSCV